MTHSVELDLRRERAAKNQSLFREVNERIDALSGPATSVAFICECTNEACDERISVARDEYERIRGDSNSFFVVKGHEIREIEEVVGSGEAHLVVSKLGTGEAVATGLDPRKRGQG